MLSIWTKRLFLFEERLKQKLKYFILKHGQMINTVKKVLFIICIILLFFVSQKTIDTSVLIVFLILFEITSLLGASLETFTTIRGFLRNAFTSTLVIAMIMSLLIFNSFDPNIFMMNKAIVSHIGYFIFIIVLSLLWFIFSTFCNAKVSTISNAILSICIALILQFNSFYWKIFEIENVNLMDSNFIFIIEKMGISQYEFLGLATDITFFPIFVMVTIGAFGALLKEYWISKNGKIDI